jgi:hypothetical protein
VKYDPDIGKLLGDERLHFSSFVRYAGITDRVAVEVIDGRIF